MTDRAGRSGCNLVASQTPPQVLRDLGYTGEQIAALRAEGAI